jgi:hypothetical protein
MKTTVTIDLKNVEEIAREAIIRLQNQVSELEKKNKALGNLLSSEKFKTKDLEGKLKAYDSLEGCIEALHDAMKDTGVIKDEYPGW